MTVKLHGDAEADLHFALINTRQCEPAGIRFVENCQGNWVVKLLLSSSRVLQDYFFCPGQARVDPAYFRPFLCQCTGFVKEHRVDLTHQFEGATILDENAPTGTESQRAEHRQRRGHADPRAEITVHNRHGTRWAHGRIAQSS